MRRDHYGVVECEIASRLVRRGVLLPFGLILLFSDSAMAQWSSGYTGSENDSIWSVVWVDEPLLGSGAVLAGSTNSFSDPVYYQALVAMADGGGEALWQRLYGEGQHVYAHSIAPVAGPSGQVETLAVAGMKGGQGWLMEVESNGGTPIWQCEYGQLGSIESVIPTHDGELVFAGSTVGDPNGLLVAKTLRTPNAPCGLEWARVFGEEDSGIDRAYSVEGTSDGGFVVAGKTDWFLGNSDGIVLKLSANGAPQWQLRLSSVYSPEGPVSFHDAIEMYDEEGEPDGFLAVGRLSFWEDSVFGWDSNTVLLRLEADGTERWTDFLGYSGGGDFVHAEAVAPSGDGGIVLAVTGRVYPPYVDGDLIIVKLVEREGYASGPFLDVQWQREVNGEAAGASEPMYSWATDVANTPGGGLIASGYFSDALVGGETDAWLLRLNEEGQIPPDCLVDADPPLEAVSHDYLFEQVDDEPVQTEIEGTETDVVPVDDGPQRRYDCRPCVVRVNLHQTYNAEDGETWETAYDDLQEGIDAAYAQVMDPPWAGATGYCEVWVARGDYHAYVSAATDTIRLRPGVHVFGGFDGGDPPADCGWETSRDDRDWEFNITRILGIEPNAPDPDLAGHVQHVVTGAARSTLDGFHVAGGDAEGGAGLPRYGGGMLNYGVSPRVRNCTFYSNLAWYGGAMANVFAAPEVTNCFFTSMPNDPVFEGANTALIGGAVFNWGWDWLTGDGAIIDGCEFVGNHAYLLGGGVHNQSSPARISGCSFNENIAYAGGGVSNWQMIDGMGAPFIETSTFEANRTEHWSMEGYYGVGSGIATLSGQYVSSSEVNVENCLFYLNSSGNPWGATLYFNVRQYPATPWVVNCTIADNTNGGISWSDWGGAFPPLVGNTILWGNSGFEIYPDCESGAAVVFSDVMGGGGCEYVYPLAENIDENPFFVTSGYQLESYSMCVDAGESWFAPLTDIDGVYRDSNPDIGAYEWY